MTDRNDWIADEKNVKIFVRILPLEESSEAYARLDVERKRIYVRCLQDMQPNRISLPREPSYWCFRTDGIFYNSSQEEIYRRTAKDLVSKILTGISCVLMGYGQTGSGKSFTITGLRNNWEHRGVVARFLSRMFAERTSRRFTNRIDYHVSFVELYGKEVNDLLGPRGTSRVKIHARDPFKDISTVYLENEENALKKIFEAEFRRSVAKGSTYPASHLATTVITFHVSNTSLITSWGVVSTAKMHIVEAAGTGTVGRHIGWKTATDIGMANLTKTQLERFFSCMTGSGSPAGIVRTSNLLKILGSAFSASSAIRFISHVRLSRDDLDITLSTLRFTAKIARLKPVKMREESKWHPHLVVHKLLNEVDMLKKELMINDLFLRQEARMNVSKSRMEQIYRTVFNYLNDHLSDFTLLDATHVEALLKCIKDLYNRYANKELEVAKLKEGYENLLKTTSHVAVASHYQLTGNGKQLGQMSGEMLNGEEMGQEQEKEEVGSIDKTTAGVTLGPHADHQATRGEILDSKRELPPPRILKIDEPNMEEVRELFSCFLKEEKNYGKLKEDFDRNAKTFASVRQRFSNILDNYFHAKRSLDHGQDKLAKHRQMRYIWELENHEGNGAFVEIEKAINRDIICQQRAVISLEEEVNQAQQELSLCSERYIEMSSKLKYGFREYCKKRDILLHFSDRSMKLLLELSQRESLELIRRKFYKFQRAMFHKTEVSNSTKRYCLNLEEDAKASMYD